jgi:hypothetical protein
MTQPQYRKYTTCIKPADFTPPPWPIGSSAAVAATWLIIVTAIVSPLVLLAGGAIPYIIGLVLLLIAACNWYLHRRLICLGTRFSCADGPMPDNQECVIGVIGSPGHSGITRPLISGLNPSKFGDNDATMDILLAPGPTTWEVNGQVDPDVDKYWNQEPQGYLVAPNTDIVNRGLAYPESNPEVRYLHCEFEGSGIADFLAMLTTILVFLVALLALEVFAPQLTAVIAILIILASIFGALSLINLFLVDPSPGDPTDIDPSLGNLQAGDIVMVSGDWIYDGGHSGWNEIHAVHNCQIIFTPIPENPDGTWSWPPDIGAGLGLDTPDKVKAARAQWCCAQSGADGAVKGGSTTDPANNWVIHPIVDGCKKPVIIF